MRVGPRTIPSLPLAIAMLVRGWPPAGVSVAGDALVAEGLHVPLIRTEVPDYEQRGQTACRALVPWRGPAQNPKGHPTFTSISFFDLFKSQQQIIEGQKRRNRSGRVQRSDRDRRRDGAGD